MYDSYEPVVMSNLQKGMKIVYFVLFHTLCINTKDMHSEIWLSTVNKIIDDWKYYKDFIVHASMIYKTEEHKSLLSRDEEYGGSVCHALAVCFLIICSKCIMKIEQFCWLWHWKNNVSHLLFSVSCNAGHTDVLQNSSCTLKPYNVKNYKRSENWVTLYKLGDNSTYVNMLYRNFY